jgi:hypothetical protein
LKFYKIINDYSMYRENSYIKIFNRYTLLQKDCIINNSKLRLLVNFTKVLFVPLRYLFLINLKLLDIIFYF